MRIGCNVWATDANSLAAVVLEAIEAIEAEKPEERAVVSIENNHDHFVDITEQDVRRGEERTYDIQGDARHDHSVTITPTMFARLARGETVVVRSSETNIHTHTLSIRLR